MGRPAAFFERLRDELLFLPIARPPEAQGTVVRLGGQVLAHGIPRDPLHQAAMTSYDRAFFRKFSGVPYNDGVVDASGSEVAEVLGPS